jgi:hypothetical protein
VPELPIPFRFHETRSMGSKFFTQKALSLGQQAFKLKALHPQFRSGLSRSSITWIGNITPSELSRTYLLRVEYRLQVEPRVSVIEPLLKRRSDSSRIPHTYPGDYLCLYRPKYREWNPNLFVAETIIPWASVWLYFYEVWHATGEWLGGGEHPPIRKRRSQKQ